MPLHSPRSANRPRKHSKTFTGCWTCRARKVKCDEGRPTCRQCNQRGVPCDGYGVRLQWMAPGTGLDNGVQPFSDAPSYNKSRRSQIVSGDNEDLPFPYEVDKALVALDALKPGELNPQGNADGFSTFIGGFGVFGLSIGHNHEDQTGPPAVSEAPVPFQTTACAPSPSSDTQHADATTGPLISGATTEGLTAFTAPISIEELCAIQGPLINPFESLPLGAEGEDITLDQIDPFDALGLQDSNGTQSIQPDTWQISLSPNILPSLSLEHLSSKERFLMHYYGTTVVNLFPVLDCPKSPWKTVHLPRMLQSAGEVTVHGSTSVIRAALRNALLSISAFYLSKHHTTHSRLVDATKWRGEAMHFHGTAMNLLKDSVNTRSTYTVRPKYKEFLATMLSMISINVMSGDIASCGLHLDAAYRLITETGKWKTQYSNKAKGLHRIYFYLRTIYNSTAIHRPVNGAKFSETWTEGSPASTDSEPALDSAQFVASPFSSSGCSDSGSYERIYAIPKTLLVFLDKTTKLIHAVTDVRKTTRNNHIPSPLAEQCDELETSIMDWQAETTPVDLISSPSANADIIQNMTRAFHKAIVIFFAQHIRLLGHRYLRPFVEEALESIEAAERIKVEWQVSASPLYWPAFVAASEAFDPALQHRFKRWYAQVEPYAIGFMSPGIRLLEEVWAEGPSNGGHRTSLWREIATRTNTNLMLT
ncbi:fungal-specific transcription factor domain-containing protein [Aspergillus varians]